jgi:beta-glucanase (GH16 family)
MLRLAFVLILTTIPAVVAISAQQPVAHPAAKPETRQSHWILTFEDDFDGAELDLSKWAPHDPWGRERPREVQAYVPKAIELRDGAAHIAARRERAKYDGRDREFTSGTMTTYGSFAQMYGRFEIRCRIPAGRGLEPGFRLLPVASGEVPGIDVFDAIGSEPTRALFGNRWGDDKTERSFTGSYPAGDLSAGFHVVAIEWNKDKIVWFVDGEERFRSVDGVPHQPLYLAINLAVGGLKARYPDESTTFPADFAIDYVRVFQRPEAISARPSDSAPR